MFVPEFLLSQPSNVHIYILYTTFAASEYRPFGRGQTNVWFGSGHPEIMEECIFA